MPENVQTTTQLHSFHTLAKKCSKFSKPGFNSTWTQNFQMSKQGLEKAEEADIGFYFSTLISKKGNLRYLQASENTNPACPKDWIVHQQYVLFSLCEREDISITFWPSQADAVNASPGPVSARQPGEAEWTPKTELQGWTWGALCCPYTGSVFVANLLPECEQTVSKTSVNSS